MNGVEDRLKAATINAKAGCVMFAAVALVFTASMRTPRRTVNAAYYEGKQVQLTTFPARFFRHAASVGPWQLGRALRQKPNDHRPNLYVVIPGKQNHLDGWEEFDHNVILSLLPAEGKAPEWDVYWALVLDPTFKEDVRGERELLLVAQTEINPSQPPEFEQIPAAVFLRKVMRIETIEELDSYRRKNGTLPQVIIVPAGFAIKASAAEFPEEQAEAAEE
jgi:hypothetical protein